MSEIKKSFTELIGNTPLLEMCNFEKKYDCKGKVIAKLEYFNPAGSAKDRVGANMIEDAEKKGILKKGSVIIEPTSGNTGIGIAAVAAVKGYRVILTMPETMSIERRKLLKAYGAEIVLTDGTKGMTGAIEKAEQLAKEIENSFIPGQFTNQSNPEAHYKTTGPEIYRQTEGKVDYLVATAGTGGTVTGTAKYLKEKIPSLKVIAVEPLGSPYLSKGVAGPHKIQGIGAGFVPEVLDMGLLDEIICVSDDDSFEYGRQAAKLEGILVGISSGAALCAASEVAKREEAKGKNIVVILPDGGERYLSTPLFE